MSAPSPARTIAATTVLAFVLLLASVDDRFFGAIPDGRQMLSSATAAARFGEIGVSSAWGYVGRNPSGATFSRYGMAQSLVEVPSVLAARLLSRIAPSAPSGPLFVLVPLLGLATAAGFLAAASLALGASSSLSATAGLALVFATPLWGYAGSDLAEPLQVALLSAGLALTLILRGSPRSWALEAATGAVLASAPLAKSSLSLVVLPLLIFAFEATPRLEAALRPQARKPAPPPRGRWPVALGAVVPAAAWGFFELVRFGRLFGGYENETFAYPALTGLLRLTLLPNKGLLFYVPALLLAPLGLAVLWRRDRSVFWVLFLPSGAILATAAGWWAWDGQAGWGPRLVLPALPFLALAAVAAISAPLPGPVALRATALLLCLLGVCVNALGALQPFAGVYAVAGAVPPSPIEPSRAEGTPYEIASLPDGTLVATAPHHLSLTPSWSPLRVHLALLSGRLRGASPAELFHSGLGLTPPFSPRIPGSPSTAFRAAVAPFRWPFWGRSWTLGNGDSVDPYALGLFDQAVRAADARDARRALSLAREVLLWPAPRRDGRLLAIGAEGALRLHRRDEALSLVEAAGPCAPWSLFVSVVEAGAAPDACLGPAEAPGYTRFAAEARIRGMTLTGWARSVKALPVPAQ